MDYGNYRFTWAEKVRYGLEYILLDGVVSVLFYRSWIPFLLFFPGVLWFLRVKRKERQKARIRELGKQFLSRMQAVSNGLAAGYSVENAFLECRQDMALMYGEEAPICQELKLIKRGLNINIPLEGLLVDMARRSGCEEIGQFAQIFALAKRNGGNMAQIIRNSAGQIGGRIELRQEIRMLLGGKKMELTIMKIMPFGILLYIDMGNPGYFDTLYHNVVGISVMTGCLLLYLGAYLLGEHIMKGIMADMV